ncbi:MAG: hypothetical protein IPH31_13355 [Lewinellaceae bacterium]|nr:hypothetical protein [Lewinellaceae bacterium]
MTHIALFWFAYKYRWQEGRKAKFIPHDNRLESSWTAIPAVVMTLLVVQGLDAWNTVMADVKPGEDYIGDRGDCPAVQLDHSLSGTDGKFGTRNYKTTTGANTTRYGFQ